MYTCSCGVYHSGVSWADAQMKTIIPACLHSLHLGEKAPRSWDQEGKRVIVALNVHAAAAAKSLQSCRTLCNPTDDSPPGSPVPGILQARTLEWVAISLSKAWKWKVKVKSLRRVLLLATPWTAAHQALPSMGFSRQEYWSGLPSPSPLYAHRFC